MCKVCKSRLVLCFDEGSSICSRCSAIIGNGSERRQPCLRARVETYQQQMAEESVVNSGLTTSTQVSDPDGDDEDSGHTTDSDWDAIELCEWKGEALYFEKDVLSYLERVSGDSDTSSVCTQSTYLTEPESRQRATERPITHEEFAHFVGARNESLGGLDAGMQWPEDLSTSSGNCEPVTSQPRARDVGCSAESVFPLGNQGAIRSNLSLIDRIINSIQKTPENISYISDEVFRREMEAHVKEPGHGKNALTYHLLLRASFRRRDASLPSFLVRTAISWMTQHRPGWDSETQYLEATRAVRAAMPGGKMEEMLQCWLKSVDPIDVEFLNASIGGYRIQPRSCWSSILNFCGFTDAADLIWRRSMLRVLPEAR